MTSIGVFLRVVHFLGLGLALGSASLKFLLLLRSRSNPGFVGTYLAVAGQITRLIMIGTGLLVLSGIGWLLLGYPVSALLIVKIVLVAITIVIGASMDKMIEPRFLKLAPKSDGPVSPEFVRVQRQYVLAEALAAGLYFVIVILWVTR